MFLFLFFFKEWAQLEQTGEKYCTRNTSANLLWNCTYAWRDFEVFHDTSTDNTCITCLCGPTERSPVHQADYAGNIKNQLYAIMWKFFGQNEHELKCWKCSTTVFSLPDCCFAIFINRTDTKIILRMALCLFQFSIIISLILLQCPMSSAGKFFEFDFGGFYCIPTEYRSYSATRNFFNALGKYPPLS